MLAYKTKLNIDTEFLQLQLPSFFTGKQVEIIVLAVADNQPEFFINKEKNYKEKDEPNEFQKFLLTAPTWSDKEYENFIETKKQINKWKIQ